MKMSLRLHMVAKQITPGLIVADIGTDHGYIPIYQLVNHLSPFAYACDVNEGPLDRAKQNGALYGIKDTVAFLLSDGLKVFISQKEKMPESIVIAGMGGLLINKILIEGKSVVEQAKELVLSPHSELPQVRKFLYQMGWKIIDEDMLKEDGKFYTVLKAVKQEEEKEKELSDLEYRYGHILLERQHPVLMEYLQKEKDTSLKILHNLKSNGSEASLFRIQEIETELEFLQKALELVGK